MREKTVRIYASAQFAIREPGKMEVDPKFHVLKPKEEELEEITGDLCVEFKKWPVPEKYFLKAMNDLVKSVKEKMIQKGMLK